MKLSSSYTFQIGAYPNYPSLNDIPTTNPKVWVRDLPQSTSRGGHYRSRSFIIEFSASTLAAMTTIQNAILTVDSIHATGYSPVNTFTLSGTIAAQNDDFTFDTDEATAASIYNVNGDDFGNAGVGAYFAYYCRFDLQLLRGLTITSGIVTFTMTSNDGINMVPADINAINSENIMASNGVLNEWPDLTLVNSAAWITSWIGAGGFTQPTPLTGSDWDTTEAKTWNNDTETFNVTTCLQALQDHTPYARGIGLVFGRTAAVGQASFHSGTHASRPTIVVTYTYDSTWPYYLEMGQITYDDDPNRFHGAIECTARWAI